MLLPPWGSAYLPHQHSRSCMVNLPSSFMEATGPRCLPRLASRSLLAELQLLSLSSPRREALLHA